MPRSDSYIPRRHSGYPLDLDASTGIYKLLLTPQTHRGYHCLYAPLTHDLDVALYTRVYPETERHGLPRTIARLPPPENPNR